MNYKYGEIDGLKVFYREAHQLIEDITEARELGALRKYRAQSGYSWRMMLLKMSQVKMI